jgi:hypothetical protein
MDMGGLLKTAAAYLGRLAETDYAVSPQASGTVNYLIDSYFAKLDARAMANRRPIRWAPADPHTHIRELWLGCEMHTVVTLNQAFPPVFRDLNTWAFSRLFAGDQAQYRVVPFLDQYEFKDMIQGSYQYRIQSEQICIAPNMKVTLPVFGNFFVEHIGSGAHLVVTADMCFESMGCSITVMANPTQQGAAEQFIADMHASLLANDIYHCKCLSYVRGHLDFMEVTPTPWSGIILKPHLKEGIRQSTVEVLQHSEQLAGLGMCPNSNVILISPPGMAKTKIFRAVSGEVVGKMTVIWCTGKSIERSTDVTSLFQAARLLAPCIVFIEDMDLFGRDRTSAYGGDNHVLNEFLACLDGAQENSGVVVMASTNDIASMDEALVNRPGRFDIKFEIPLPDAEDRSNMLKCFLSEYHATPDATVTQDTWATVINMTEGLTGAYIRLLAKTTVIRAVSEGKCGANGAACSFSADNLNAASEQVMKNYAIGKKAKKHHIMEVDTHVAQDAAPKQLPGILPLKRASGNR